MYNFSKNNIVNLKGHVVRITKIHDEKEAFITLSIDNGKRDDGTSYPKSYIQTRCSVPAMFKNLIIGTLVEINGHISSYYYEKDGNKIYTQDIRADYIIYLESKKTVKERISERNNQNELQ